jgi:hypothetical protein
MRANCPLPNHCNVRLGSFGDIATRSRSFCFAAESRHSVAPPVIDRGLKFCTGPRVNPATRRDGLHLDKTGQRLKRTAISTTQWIHSKVSRTSLQKTGVFLDSAGDFWDFSVQKVRTPVSRNYR